jgi:DNA-binding GntR family transcriptional regulator
MLQKCDRIKINARLTTLALTSNGLCAQFEVSHMTVNKALHNLL